MGQESRTFFSCRLSPLLLACWSVPARLWQREICSYRENSRMSMFSKRLGWVAPIMALAIVSVEAAVNQATAQTASPDSSATIASGAAQAGGSHARVASLGSRPATILGSAWNADNTPIKGANLRLRNVVTGKIEAETKANEAGEFEIGR